MKTVNNCENPSTNPLHTACCGIQELAYDSVNCSVSWRWFWNVFRYYFLYQVDDRLLAFSKAELKLTIPFELPPVSLGVGGGGILMRLPSGSKCFHRSKQKFKKYFLRHWSCIKNLKTISAYTESTGFLRSSKKLFILWHNPFKALVPCVEKAAVTDRYQSKQVSSFYMEWKIREASFSQLFFNSSLWSIKESRKWEITGTERW